MLIPILLKGLSNPELLIKILGSGILTCLTCFVAVWCLSKSKLLAGLLTLFYLLLPSRLLLLAVEGNFRRSLVLTLLPLLILTYDFTVKKPDIPLLSYIPKYVNYLILFLIHTLIAFLDPMDGLIISGLFLLGGLSFLVRRRTHKTLADFDVNTPSMPNPTQSATNVPFYTLLPALFSIFSGILWNYRFWLCIFTTTDELPFPGFSIHSLIPTGYFLSDYLMVWTGRAGQPGPGIGLLFGILLAFWYLLFSNTDKMSNTNPSTYIADNSNSFNHKNNEDDFFFKTLTGLGILCLLLSLRLPLWDFAMRSLPFMTKLISAMDQLRFLASFSYVFLLFGLVPIYQRFFSESFENRAPSADGNLSANELSHDKELTNKAILNISLILAVVIMVLLSSIAYLKLF